MWVGSDSHKWDSNRHALAWGRWCSWVVVVLLAMGRCESWVWWLWQKMDLIWFILFYFSIFLFGFMGMDLAMVDVNGGSDGGSGGEWFGFWIWNLDFVWVF